MSTLTLDTPKDVSTILIYAMAYSALADVPFTLTRLTFRVTSSMERTHRRHPRHISRLHLLQASNATQTQDRRLSTHGNRPLHRPLRHHEDMADPRRIPH